MPTKIALRDDGAFSFEPLHSRGARLVANNVQLQTPSVIANRNGTSCNTAPIDSEPSQAELSEAATIALPEPAYADLQSSGEDPFGHAHLGLDDDGGPVGDIGKPDPVQ